MTEVEVYVKGLVLERMKVKGLAEADMKPSDVDLDKYFVSSESRFVIALLTRSG